MHLGDLLALGAKLIRFSYVVFATRTAAAQRSAAMTVLVNNARRVFPQGCSQLWRSHTPMFRMSAMT